MKFNYLLFRLQDVVTDRGFERQLEMSDNQL